MRAHAAHSQTTQLRTAPANTHATALAKRGQPPTPEHATSATTTPTTVTTTTTTTDSTHPYAREKETSNHAHKEGILETHTTTTAAGQPSLNTFSTEDTARDQDSHGHATHNGAHPAAGRYNNKDKTAAGTCLAHTHNDVCR